MNAELIAVVFTFLATVALAIPLGKYISKVFKGEKSLLDFMAPLEQWIFRKSEIDVAKEMNWKQHLVALLSINMIWFIYAFVMFLVQGIAFFNPDGNPSMSPDLSFNTAISFLVNCNLQHYSGETGLSYLTQLTVITFLQFVSAATGIAALIVVFNAMKEKTGNKLGNFYHIFVKSQLTVITFLQFVSAATGIAALIVVFNAMKEKTGNKLGNFYHIFVKSITRILLPISIVIATLLVFNGTPSSFDGKDKLYNLEGSEIQVSRGPAAGMIAIKHLGTNGGGWFGANSAHPLENPNYFTNVIEMIAQVLIPLALIFALGFYLNRKKMSYVIFTVMTIGMLSFLIPTLIAEANGNPAIAKMGIDQSAGSMEGKEVRFGSIASAYWSIVTTIISTGSVNSMHDSTMPISGAMQLLGMMTNAFYGGCGVGILNYYIFIIIAVFISGLMVGRTPEFLGRKIEAREMKIATLIALLHPVLILVGTAISSYVYTKDPSLPWLNNPGYHGFSEMLYEYTSAAANNGSGFEGLGDNTPFWNITTGFVLLLGRFLPIIGPVAIAGILANKKFIPESAGTLRTDTGTFGIMTYAVIMILAALAFFPALVLGPLAEYFTLYQH